MRGDLRRLASMARSILVDVVYPKVCAGCGMRGLWVCESCEASVPSLTQHICVRCGSPASPEHRCQTLGPHVTTARAAYPYTGWAGASIRRFKYADEPTRAEDLAARMIPLLAAFDCPSVIVPVPLHPKKLNLRGYNQSELLAERIAAQTNLPMKPLLIRIRATRSQVTLDRQSRHHNVAEAFALSPDWATPQGERILLIDDVRTTGATTDACAKVLKEDAKAEAVSVLTFAQELSKEGLQRWMQVLNAPPSQL